MKRKRGGQFRDVRERFNEKFTKRGKDDCWEWHGAISKKSGYGYFGMNRDGVGHTTAHRAAFILKHGPIASTVQVDHKCRNRKCVNFRHLEAVTNKENTLRGLSGRMVTVCKNGHPFTEENTLFKKTGQRICKACRKFWNGNKYRGRDAAFWRNYRAKRKAEKCKQK